MGTKILRGAHKSYLLVSKIPFYIGISKIMQILRLFSINRTIFLTDSQINFEKKIPLQVKGKVFTANLTCRESAGLLTFRRKLLYARSTFLMKTISLGSSKLKKTFVNNKNGKIH